MSDRERIEALETEVRILRSTLLSVVDCTLSLAEATLTTDDAVRGRALADFRKASNSIMDVASPTRQIGEEAAGRRQP